MPRSDLSGCPCTSRRIKFSEFPAVTTIEGLPCRLDNKGSTLGGGGNQAMVNKQAGIMCVCRE